MPSELLSLLTFLLGLVLGNWLAIGRDKRQEFNEAVSPIRRWLIEEMKRPTPYGPWPSDHEVDRFAHCLSAWHRARFLKHWASFKALHQSKQIQDGSGQVFYSDESEIRQALGRLFRVTTPR
ncbi:hypothetical protein [Xanthomonas sp. NCPPB 2632]|uniref:hypothetical protein n=1 Tax=Xanthomonas sp. NCPPB 2632 TaxID=3240912 RepID=UPI003517A6AE